MIRVDAGKTLMKGVRVPPRRDRNSGQEVALPRRLKLALLVGAILAAGPASAQALSDENGTTTEMQDRRPSQRGDSLWNMIGLIGLLGLIGLWRPSDNDGYTDDPI